MVFTCCLSLPYGDAFSGLTFSGGALIKLEMLAKAFMYQRCDWRGSRSEAVVSRDVTTESKPTWILPPTLSPILCLATALGECCGEAKYGRKNRYWHQDE